MGFNPEAYLASIKQSASADGFNPDAYLAENKIATPAPAQSKGVVPKPGAGWDWHDKLQNALGATGQSIADLAKSAAVPALNVLSLAPGKFGDWAQTEAQDLQRDVSPISQIAGGILGGVPLALGASALAAPLMAAAPAVAPLTAIGTGAALGAATSAPGDRGYGALFGAAGAAVPGALTAAKYGIGKFFAPGIKDAADAAAVQAAQGHGFVVPPSELTGASPTAQEIAGLFGPFAKQVPKENVNTFGAQTFKTLGLKGETQINAQNVSRAMQKIAGDLQSQIGSAKLTINPEVANAVNNAIAQNKAMLAELAVDPESKGVAAAIYRAQDGQQISGQDYYKVSQWLRNKAAATNDGATSDALKSLDRAWEYGAQGDTARVNRALRVYRTRMAQAKDLQKMMVDANVAAGVTPVNPDKLYSTMARGKPTVLSGKSPYKLAPLSQAAANAQVFGNGSSVPAWAKRAASMEGLAAVGGGDVRLPYTGKLGLIQKGIFGTAGLLSRNVLNQLTTDEGQNMLLNGYKLTPQDLQKLARWSALSGALATPVSNQLLNENSRY
jgi:hypothetical protein